MQDASVKRLSQLISEPRQDGSGNKKRLQPRGVLAHIKLAEGWFSFFLLLTVVYSTIWSVQAAGWVDHLNILTLTTALGLLIGVIAAKQRLLPRLLVHPLAILFGLLLAFWQTAGADDGGNIMGLVNGIHQWIVLALAGGTSADDSIFLFFITALGFLLAYTSAWLLYRTRSPWLMILANAVVLLINLSNIDPGYIIFLVIFLVAALLLLLRFNLYESSARWKSLGLRTSDDLGWEFMQAGALLSIGILILTWFIPWGYVNDAAAQIWSADNNPWVVIQNNWNRLIAITGGYNSLNHGNFTDTLSLGGNPNLSNDLVFTVTFSDDGQYLQALSYSTYDGRSWSNGPSSGLDVKPGNTDFDPYTTDLRAVQQHINVVNPPGGQYPYLFGASQIASTNQPSQVVSRNSDGTVVAWLRTDGKLAASEQYNVTSYVSAADVATLETVPFPKNAPSYTPNPLIPDEAPPVDYYDPNVLHTYLQLPKNLDPNILALTKKITSGYKNMYDMAIALQNYLQDNYHYNTNILLPPQQEGVSWFLFRSGFQGFCNYFATAMAVMAREMGMPARVVAGYTNGKLNTKTHQWDVLGSDAHAWTQIYFAGYGWVNFEPSATFPTFVRPLHIAGGAATVTPGGPGASSPGTVHKPLRDLNLPDTGSGSGSGLSQASVSAQIRQDVGIALLALLLLILAGLAYFSVWWRRLYRRYGISAQVFGRLSMLADWAGLAPRRSQTPYEYAHALAEAVPEQAVTIERLGDIYVRDRWADPSSSEHPRRNGEINELPRIWEILQPRLFLYVMRHPHFLRRLPDKIGVFIHQRRANRRKRRLDDIITNAE
ncbi:MAG TPA: transglutaminaseTgpA domain-containing protein [Ktedonobacteraceae bacterium]|nr:transglutaminaseTgpA domain-containing protein [Ktedonobacteraceae bacterium]